MFQKKPKYEKKAGLKLYQIELLNKISPAGTDLFPKTGYCLGEEIANPDAILVRSASMHEMELPASLKAIARAGAGVNNIPLDKCSEAGIVVFNTPGANANAVKELVLAGLLISARKIVPGIEWVKTLKGQGAEVTKQVEKGKSKFVGPELKGKKLGVIGLGAIGVQVANTATHFGMEVLGYDPYLSVDAAWSLSRNIHKAKSLKEIYETCDFITVHVPLTPETKGMINSQSIQTMKHGVRIMNFSRGELVVAEDMIQAIQDKEVRCYVTDFPTDEMLGIDGIISIPHLGASTPESEDNCAAMAAEEVMDYLENGNIKNSVNLPAVQVERGGDTRIGIIHRNIPTMINQITQCIADENINIENLTNKSRKDFAYTVVDVYGDVSSQMATKLTAIEGVIRVTIYR